MLVKRRVEDQPHVLLVDRLERSLENRGEVVTAHQRNRETNVAGSAARERPGAAVRHVPALLDDAHHELAGLGRDVVAFVDDPGDGRDRHAGEVRDLVDRHLAPPVLVDVRRPRHDRALNHFRKRFGSTALSPCDNLNTRRLTFGGDRVNVSGNSSRTAGVRHALSEKGKVCDANLVPSAGLGRPPP